MTLVTSPILLVGITALAVIMWRRWRTNTSYQGSLPLPPGPSPLPIVGNVTDIPQDVPPWETYDRMAHMYGDIVSLNIFGQPIIVLSSQQAINDLLEKRSSKYSSRPKSVMLHELMGMDWALTIMPYGEQFRRVRKPVHKHFNVNATHKYYDIQLKSTQSFLRRLLLRPNDLFAHTRHLTAKIILKVTYDIDVAEENDPYIFVAEKTLAAFGEAAQPGRYLVDVVPILKYVPSWFPGAQFQKDAIFAREMSRRMVHNPFDAVKRREMFDQPTTCVTSSLLEEVKDSPNREEEEDIIRKAAAIAYAGGADTTVAAIQSFFLAMVLYPDVQKKAQAELDAVVGLNRLPGFEDLNSLPYVSALIKECTRWKMVSPLGVPHYTTENDEYRGYHIAKGTVVIANAYSILHDPALFPEPEEFKPERFLKDSQLDPDGFDPNSVAFGFGRRVCPGRAFALDSIFSVVTNVLHTFNIAHATDAAGNQVPVRPEMSGVIISYPVPFACSIKPRSTSAETLVRGTATPKQ